MKNVAIIGGGITGLSLAYYLQKQGIPFTIFEKSGRVGGVIRSEVKNDFLIEKGPNTGVIANLELAELLEDIKSFASVQIADEQSKKRLIWKNGKWNALPSGIVSAITTPLFTVKDKFKVLGEAFRKKGNHPTESLAETVKRRLGQSFLDYAIDPFVSGIYAGNPNYLITKYAFAKLYNLEDKYGSFIKGSIRIGKERSTDYKQKVNKNIFSFEQGLEMFPKALLQIIGKENVQLNQQYLKIKRLNNGKYEVNGQTFSDVASTVQAGQLKNIFSFIKPDCFSKIDNLKYAKVIEASIGFKQWNGMQLDAFGGLIPSKAQKNILGILFMSSQFPNRAPENGAFFSVFVGGMQNSKITSLDEPSIKQLIAKDFSTMMQLSSFNPDLFVLTYHHRAIAQYGLDSKDRIEAIENIEKENPGIHLKGSIVDGIGLADRVAQAYKIANKIAEK